MAQPAQTPLGRDAKKHTKKPLGPKVKKEIVVDTNLFAATSVGPYQLLRLLGKGVSGMVYEAKRNDGLHCAVKRVRLQGLSKKDQQELELEIQLLNKLSHVNIVKHVETFKVAHSLNMVLEFVDGGTLTDQLSNWANKPESLVAYYTLQILAGLAYIHRQGIIHRDLKGVNILSNKDGVVKLADFGVAKLFMTTKTHSVIGTPYWMAPEIIQMSGKESPACDIWSLGCTIIELLTGEPPFFGLHPMAALFQMVQLTAPPINPEKCSIQCLDFLTRCFQQAPADRATAVELLSHPWVVGSEKDGEDLVRASVILMHEKHASQVAVVKKEAPRSIVREVKQELVDCDDMVDMQHMTAEVVTDNLQNRFARNCIYTNISSILIAINPYRDIDGLYTQSKLNMFNYKIARGEMIQSPHIYGLARAAFANATSVDIAKGVNRNQAILISGESGAGKTETTKHVLRYFTAMSGDMGKGNQVDIARASSIEEKLMQANPILEAFGNAKTLRNDNSSRFGKWISIQFSSSAFATIGGACILKYLLEESRVASVPLGERNYNIFYQVCADVVSKEGDFDFAAHNFRYLVHPEAKDPKETVVIAGVDDLIEFQEVVQALHCLGFSPAERRVTFEIIQAILHLGNVIFVARDKQKGYADISLETVKHLGPTANFLGLTESSLREALCVKVQVIAHQRIDKPRTVQEATKLRDAISKSLYGRLFTWLIWRFNLALASRDVPAHRDATSAKPRRMSLVAGARLEVLDGSLPTPPLPSFSQVPFSPRNSGNNIPEASIGVLDIFGFEVFPKNSFEQLCINFANETLQQYFIHYIFKLELALYTQEQLAVDTMTYLDNKQCVELLGGKHPSIFAMLTDELTIPGGTDLTLLEKLKREHKKNPLFSDRLSEKNSFIIHHYAGDVVYDCEGFLEKNQSKAGEDVTNLLQGSQEPIVALLYSTSYELLGGRDPYKALDKEKKEDMKKDLRKRPQEAVGAKFQESLKDLVAALESATPHFVRCIKPNHDKRAGIFDRSLVLTQLRTSGMLDSVVIRKLGYPERLPHAVFLNRYNHLYPGRKASEILQQVAEEVKQRFPDESAVLFQIGVTKVFLKPRVWDYLEVQRAVLLGKVVIRLQKILRGFVARRRVAKMRTSIRSLGAGVQSGDLKAIDTALSRATEVGVISRVVQAFWIQRNGLEQTRLSRRALADVLLDRSPSIGIRLAALTLSIGKVQKTLQSFPDPCSAALLALGMELQAVFAHLVVERSRLRVGLTTDDSCAKEARKLLSEIPKQVEDVLKRHEAGVSRGGLGGLTDPELLMIREELIRSCSEAEECVELNQLLEKCDAFEKPLMELCALSQPSWALILADLPKLKIALDRATEGGYRREARWYAEACLTALPYQDLIHTALAWPSRAHIEAALQAKPGTLREYVNKALLFTKQRILELTGSELGAGSVEEASVLLKNSQTFLELVERMPALLTPATIHLDKCLEYLQKSRASLAGSRLASLPLGTSLMTALKPFEKRVVEEVRLQLTRCSTSSDATALEAALLNGERAALSRDDLRPVQQRLIVLKLDGQMQTALASRSEPQLTEAVAEVEKALQELGSVNAEHLQQLRTSGLRAISVLRGLVKLEAKCMELNSSEEPSTLRAAQALLIEVLAAGAAPREVATFQAAIDKTSQAIKKQEDERKRQEDERKRQEDERKRQEDERKRQEDERKRQEDERKRQEDEERLRKQEAIAAARKAELEAENKAKKLQEEKEERLSAEEAKAKSKTEEIAKEKIKADEKAKADEKVEDANDMPRSSVLSIDLKAAESPKVRVITRPGPKPPGTPVKLPVTPTAPKPIPQVKMASTPIAKSPAVKPTLAKQHTRVESLTADLDLQAQELSASERRLRDLESSLQAIGEEDSRMHAQINEISEEARRKQDAMVDVALRRVQSQTSKLARIQAVLTASTSENDQDPELMRKLALAELERMQLQLEQEDQLLSGVELDQEKLSRGPPRSPIAKGHQRTQSSGGRPREQTRTPISPTYSHRKGDFPVAPPLPPFANLTPLLSFQTPSEPSISSLSSSTSSHNRHNRSHSLQLIPDLDDLDSESSGSVSQVDSLTSRVLMEGYLTKKSPGGIPLMRVWQKRYFVLQAPWCVKYFTDASQTTLKGVIDLDRVEKCSFRECRLTFLMEGKADKRRKFSLKASSQSEADKWVKAIQIAFQELETLGRMHSPTSSPQPEFERPELNRVQTEQTKRGSLTEGKTDLPEGD